MNIPNFSLRGTRARKRTKNKNEKAKPIPAIDSALSWVCIIVSDVCVKVCLEHLINLKTVITPKITKKIMCGAQSAIL
jgi:hypothetical protein